MPDIKRNLFSVGASAKKGYKVTFNDQNVIDKEQLERQGKMHAIGLKQSNDIISVIL